MNELRRGIAEIRPVLERNKYVPPDRTNGKAGCNTGQERCKLYREQCDQPGICKKSFNLGIRSDSNGKVTYASSNKK